MSRVWCVVWLGVAVWLASPGALAVGVAGRCTGPKCPTLADGLLFLVKAFIWLNVAGALLLIIRDVHRLWQRWRQPQAGKPADTDAADPPAD